MSTMRVTQSLLTARTVRNIQNAQRRMFDLQEQLATGFRINSPSDDPTGTQRALNARTAIGKNEQYLNNISRVGPQLLETGTTIQTVVDNMRRANELAIQGATGTQTSQQFNAIAEEVNQLLEENLVSANLRTNNRYLFSGTRTLTPAFEAERDANGDITSVNFMGNTEKIRVAISDGVTANVNEDGQTVFQSEQDVFQLLIDLRDNLLAGDQGAVQDRLAEFPVAENQLLSALSRVGAIENRLERVTRDTEDFTLQFQQTLSDAIDADFAETIINLNVESNAFQAALIASARVIQPSLLDFIR